MPQEMTIYSLLTPAFVATMAESPLEQNHVENKHFQLHSWLSPLATAGKMKKE